MPHEMIKSRSPGSRRATFSPKESFLPSDQATNSRVTRVVHSAESAARAFSAGVLPQPMTTARPGSGAAVIASGLMGAGAQALSAAHDAASARQRLMRIILN